VAERLPKNHLTLVPDYNDGAGRFSRTDGFFGGRGDGSKRLRQELGGGGRSAQQGGRRQQKMDWMPPFLIHIPGSPSRKQAIKPWLKALTQKIKSPSPPLPKGEF
jgi:hypothetical protein